VATHQRNTHSRSRQPGRRIKLLLTSEEHAALDRLQRRHHLESKDDALALAIFRLAIQRILNLSLTDQALCVMNIPEREISKRFRPGCAVTEIIINSQEVAPRLTKVALHFRVSTSHGQDPELQLRELREYAASRGWTITEEHEYIDCDVSSSKASQPALNPYRNILFFPSQPQLLMPERQSAAVSLHAAVIQAPCRRWTKPWRHQRTVLLFAESAHVMRQRLETEGRVGPRCFVLQVFKVKGGPQ
jgi:hypothetical protein